MENERPIPVNRAARLLNIPVGWLRAEVEGGRLPGLKAGRALLVDLPTIADRLAERARTGEARR